MKLCEDFESGTLDGATWVTGTAPVIDGLQHARDASSYKSEIRLSGQLQSGGNHFGVGTDNRTPTGTGDTPPR